MDINSSMERRYSFNMAQTNPVAESTHLGNSFSWGSSMSMRPRSNSSLCLNHTYSSAKSKNATKIDARIAADVQSKGLASRIVKYHESGARLNRSMSAHNLYSRPGLFPAVTLQKTELPYRATKQDLSMVRIPPPEKSTFYGNTISSLLKSNSVVGLKSKRTEENRPIIHPPPSENDMAPTRSVLDVLKEISRKRINSDDLETDETSKKYCNRGGGDFIDSGTCAASITAANIVTSTTQRFKRQRDCIAPHQSVHTTEIKTSPEQAKKRICNYNNDITSSLSSSLKSGCNEKKIALYNSSKKTSSNLESFEKQTNKIQCFHNHQNNIDQIDVRLENLVNNSTKTESVKPITSIPTTPCVLNESKSGLVGQRNASNSYHNSNERALRNEIQYINKPLLTLFNKKYEVEVEKASKESIGKSDELSNFDEYAGIPFVKPKKMSISGLKNPVIERTQKSKLALMLSGLRGELYQNSEKNIADSSKEKQEKVEDKNLNVKKDILISASKSVSTVTTTLTTVTSSCNLNSTVGVSATTSTTDLTSNTISNVLQTNTTPNKTSSPLVGLKLTQIKSPTNYVASTENDTKVADTNSKTNVPVLGGFSLNGAKSSISATPLTTVTSQSAIIPASTVSKASSLVTLGQSKSSNFSFGLNLPTTKDSALLFPLSPAKTINSDANKSSLPNISLSTAKALKPANTFVSEANVKPLTTTATSTSTVESGSLLFSNSPTKPISSFNFSVPSQTTESLKPMTTSTISLNTTLSQTSSSGMTFGAVTTTSVVTSITPTITTFSTQSKTSAPIDVTKISTNSSSPCTFSFSSQPTTTTVSTLSANNNTGMPIQSSNNLFSFGSLSKTQNSASNDKNKSNHTSESNNPFNANSSTFFGASNLKASAGAPLFGSSANNTEKNIFDTSNVAPTSVFGSNSVKNDSQIFGSSGSSPFGGSNTNNSTRAPFSFGGKPSDTQSANNANTPGGFSFGSTNSTSSEGGTFGFANTIKPTTTESSSSVFGSVPSTALKNKSFTFGSTSKKTENISTSSGGFSFSTTTAQKPTFSFGTTVNSTAGFGVSSPLPAETSLNKSFSFGTQQSQVQQSSMPVSNSASSNIFGSPGPSKTAPAFNFNSGSSTNSQQTVQPINNIFASPSSNITTGPGDRLIRRATRRLQK